jgi:hypothetical protein
MSEFPVGLREVVPNQTVPEKCREFLINTGSSTFLLPAFNETFYLKNHFEFNVFFPTNLY